MNKLNDWTTRKLPRLNARKWVNIKSIWTHLRSFNPEALAQSNRLIYSCTLPKQLLLSLAAWFIVSFGQPAAIYRLGPLAATVGFALFFLAIVDEKSGKRRFVMGASWFAAVQLVQLFWLLSHPYSYIYPLYLLVALLLGLQFGALSLFVERKNVESLVGIAAIASFWVMMEWLRLFVFSGFSWNPAGLYLSTTHYSMQMASLAGVFGMTMWVMATNLLFTRTLLYPKRAASYLLFGAFALFPYLFGWLHYSYHEGRLAEESEKREPLEVLLVQTAFPVEEMLGLPDTPAVVAYVTEEWEKILHVFAKVERREKKEVDLLVLPEFVVPFGTYTFMFPYESAVELFRKQCGEDSLKCLPKLQSPFATKMNIGGKEHYFVNNAFFAQSIANIFDAPILLGLEDVDEDGDGKRDYFSAAIMIHPNSHLTGNFPYSAERYEKRVLVPMGEYIPFTFCKELAKSYGIEGSFTPGQGAKVLSHKKLPIGVSICYEETFGDLMRESRENGAEILVNLTSDVWYPDSALTLQHLEHARLRSVEMGVPLVRSCNTGITCAIDSLGRTIAALDEYDGEGKWLADALLVSVPRYHYPTLYSKAGDGPVIGLSILSLALFFQKPYNRKRRRKMD